MEHLTVKVLIIIIACVSFISCKQTANDKLDKKLSEEFYDSIKSQNAEKFEFNYDGLTPQESYFKDGKIQFLKFRQNPEAGFSEGMIYFNSQTDSIDKYILRQVVPEWKTYNDDMFDKYFDTIYIISPNLNKTKTYSKNNLIDSTFRPYINDWNVKFIYKMKKGTEEKYNSR